MIHLRIALLLRLADSSSRVHHDDDHRVTTEEHLGDHALLRDGLVLGTALGVFHPDFSDSLEQHVAMAVKSLNVGQELLVVAAVDQNLRLVAHSLSQNGERTMLEGFLLGSLL